MPEIILEFATRQIRRTFERAIGKSVAKILTELITNSDDSYKRLTEAAEGSNKPDPSSNQAPITIIFDRSNRKFFVIDQAEGITAKEMEERFGTYGKESLDRARGLKTRSLFGKGLRDVLFTQKNGQVKSIKNGMFHSCRFKWRDADGQEKPVLDIRPPVKATAELRKALRIPENGTAVEFSLRDDVPNPQPEKLVETLSRFYMLRMINSSPSRALSLHVIRKGRPDVDYPISYRFPEIDVAKRLQESMTTDVGTEIGIEGDIGVTKEELSQGEAPYTEREGGLLTLDEDNAVLDLQLYGFDDDPAARRISGLIRLSGAGEYIRAKLNQSDPEEVLTETRDGFSPQHPFYRQLREAIRRHLEPVVAKLRELGPKPKVSLSEKTKERHNHAMDILNRLASQMLGTTARLPIIPAKKRVPPIEGIRFLNSHLGVQTGLPAPAVLLINTQMVGAGGIVSIVSDHAEIAVEPQLIVCGEDEDGSGVAVKVLRVKSEKPDITGRITAAWNNARAILEVNTTTREVLTPSDGIEFERDEYNVRLERKRNLRLYVDTEKVPIGSDIAIISNDPAVKVAQPRVTVESYSLVAAKIAQIDIPVVGIGKKKAVPVLASHEDYTAQTAVSVVKQKKKEPDKHGLFKGYDFQPLNRKVQTLWSEGLVLINTKDPVNARYFGDDPGKAVEERMHCQVLLADLVLNECLQIMVSQALDTGRLDRRFPNNPEIDVRSYVDEKKFDIGAQIHNHFVPGS